jgi:hypothetical protein
MTLKQLNSDTDLFEIIFNAFKRGMKPNDTRFEFDGDKLHSHATPNYYDIIDGEILDAFILSTSQQINTIKTIKTKETVFDEESDLNDFCIIRFSRYFCIQKCKRAYIFIKK